MQGNNRGDMIRQSSNRTAHHQMVGMKMLVELKLEIHFFGISNRIPVLFGEHTQMYSDKALPVTTQIEKSLFWRPRELQYCPPGHELSADATFMVGRYILRRIWEWNYYKFPQLQWL